MSEIINLMVYFANGSVALALFVRTIYLIKKHIKCALMTDEDEEELERELNELENDLDRKLCQFNIIVPGARDWMNDVLDWIEEHHFLSIVIGYIFCLVPIVNLVLTLAHLKNIFES